MIRWMHQQDPNVELCFNDYNVVAEGMFTSAYKRQAKLATARGVPVTCLGVQGHYKGDPINPAATLVIKFFALVNNTYSLTMYPTETS